MHVERRSVDIEAGGCHLPASLGIPESAKAVIMDFQPSELTALEPRDGQVLERLCARGFATLAAGLLTPAEGSSEELATLRRFDIDMLASRALKVLDWMRDREVTAPIGVLARGTAAAAALSLAARRRIGAIVSVVGRPDLVAAALPLVDSPTLFLVAAENEPSQHFSQLGADRMHCAHELRVIPGAGLFEGPAEADAAARLALHWFEQHLAPPPL